MRTSNRANIVTQLKSSLTNDLLCLLAQADKFCKERGEKLFIAGGMVRDLLLGLPSKDIDLVVEGDARPLALELARRFHGEVTPHERFRTAKITIGKLVIDIATARKETYTHPGALPQVEEGTLVNDLKRRDFSINSMAVAISEDEFGRLIDPLGGLADLKAGIIRILHANSFKDDPTRIFRAIRYEQRFGFEIEPGTLTLMAEDKKNISRLSADRLRYEFECILAERAPEKVLARAYQLSILEEVFEGLVFDSEASQWFKTARKAKYGQCPADLYMALLFFRLSEVNAKNMIKRLNLPHGTAKAIADTCTIKQAREALSRKDLQPAEIYNLLTGLNPLAIEACSIACSERLVRNNLSLYLLKLRHVRPIIRGEDLIRLGYIPGPAIGQALQKIQQERLNGGISTRKEEIKMAKRLLKNNSDGK